jgi:hypothetical protein
MAYKIVVVQNLNRIEHLRAEVVRDVTVLSHVSFMLKYTISMLGSGVVTYCQIVCRAFSEYLIPLITCLSKKLHL